MKRTSFQPFQAYVFFLIIFFSVFTYQNDAIAQTSEQEYLYSIHGYKEQLQKGLDDKKGYFWKPLFQHKFPHRKNGFFSGQFLTGIFDFEALHREGESKPCAFVVIFREQEGISKKDGIFICIPHPKTEKDIQAMAEKYLIEESKFSENVFRQYAIGLSKLAITLATL